MRIVAIGDIHGRDSWKHIVRLESKNPFDYIVFVGDYFDSREGILPQQQKDNFKEIIQFKNQNKDKVILLLGNHDYHYLRTTKETYSGFQQFQKTDISELLHDAIDNGLIEICFQIENILFSHAGITKTWCLNNNIDFDDIENSINELFIYKPNSFKFTLGNNFSTTGDDIEQSPIWVRPYSLNKDCLNGYIHVVGHTAQDEIVITDNIVLIDVLHKSIEYLVIDNLKFRIKKINVIK